MKHTLLKIILTLIGFFFFSIVHAANRSEWNMEKLCTFSDCIIVGVIEKTEYTISPTTGFPITLTTVKITSSLKGNPGTVVTLRTPGGRKNGRTRFIIGMPSFEQGEEVVLFLKKTDTSPSNYYDVSGWLDGKYTIKTNPNTSQKIAYKNTEQKALPIIKGTKGDFSTTKNNHGISLNKLLGDISKTVSSMKGEK